MRFRFQRRGDRGRIALEKSYKKLPGDRSGESDDKKGDHVEGVREKISWIEAAEVLGMSLRASARRITEEYEGLGLRGCSMGGGRREGVVI